MQGIKTTQIDNLDAEILLQKFSIIDKHFENLEKHFASKSSLEFLTVKEVASLLKVTKMTVHNWTKQKLLICYKIGNQIRYKRSEVENAISRKH